MDLEFDGQGAMLDERHGEPSSTDEAERCGETDVGEEFREGSSPNGRGFGATFPMGAFAAEALDTGSAPGSRDQASGSRKPHSPRLSIAAVRSGGCYGLKGIHGPKVRRVAGQGSKAGVRL
jgi:hypothetical protein